MHLKCRRHNGHPNSHVYDIYLDIEYVWFLELYIPAYTYNEILLNWVYMAKLNVPRPIVINAHNKSGTHFTNDFSITIQIRRKFHLALIQLLMIISRQNLAHATTAQLSCHVPNIVAITFLVFGWEQNEISITFELWWKNC